MSYAIYAWAIFCLLFLAIILLPLFYLPLTEIWQNQNQSILRRIIKIIRQVAIWALVLFLIYLLFHGVYIKNRIAIGILVVILIAFVFSAANDPNSDHLRP